MASPGEHLEPRAPGARAGRITRVIAEGILRGGPVAVPVAEFEEAAHLPEPERRAFVVGLVEGLVGVIIAEGIAPEPTKIVADHPGYTG